MRCKALTKKERQGLVDYINEVDISVLSDAVHTKLSEQSLADNLQSFTDVLCGDETLFHDTLHAASSCSFWRAVHTMQAGSRPIFATPIKVASALFCIFIE